MFLIALTASYIQSAHYKTAFSCCCYDNSELYIARFCRTSQTRWVSLIRPSVWIAT